jgi:glutamate racemase
MGGLTVLGALRDTLPHESFIYLGDTAHLPYGDKSRELVIHYALENAQFLASLEIKALVIACNTVSACALEILQNTLSIPVIGVIDPAVERVVSKKGPLHVGIWGTKRTILSGVYRQKILALRPSAQVFELACPLLVPLIEEHGADHPATRLILQEYLKPILKIGCEMLVLGCTHYPLLASLIKEEAQEAISIFDSASDCAKKVKEILQKEDLLREASSDAELSIYVTDDLERFRNVGRRFYPHLAHQIELKPNLEAIYV